MQINQTKILVTGANGMLGKDLVWRLDKLGSNLTLTDCFAADRVQILDITDLSAVRGAFLRERPQLVINCAAYTNVDRSESDYQAAFNVNASGPKNLAHCCSEFNAKLVHISTDYVFGGQKYIGRCEPFREEEETSPCGIYGLSKKISEEFVAAILPHAHIIIRTSWLHGKFGPNFIHTMLRVGREKHEIAVVNDQVGSPTWSGWLAETIIALAEKDAVGVFHGSSRGNISWFDFAKEIFEQAKLSVKVVPQTTAECNRLAPRPPYSTLDVSKLERALGCPCLDWREDIARHLKELVEAGELL